MTVGEQRTNGKVVGSPAKRQRLQALVAANASRSELKVLRGRVRAGALTVADVLACPPDIMAGMALWEIVPFAALDQRRIRRLGVWLGARALDAGVNLGRTIGQSSERDREWLAGELARFEPCRRRRRVDG